MNRIEINNISKVIHGTSVLKDITLSMSGGRIYGIQGINGSGKTMLMRTILGLIHPTSGSIHINGKELGKDMEFPQSIGFLLENPSFLDRYSGLDNLKLLASIQGQVSEKQIIEALKTVGLDPADKKKYKKYSLGMKQRLGIAAAIMERPDIVILDEPTNALDESGVNIVKNIIRNQKRMGAIVILTCHDIAVLQELSDEVIKLEEGQVVEQMETAKIA